MRRVVHMRQVNANGAPGPDVFDGPYEMPQNMAGYILEQLSDPPPPGMVSAWGYLVLITSPFHEPEMDMTAHVQPQFTGEYPKPLRLRPIGRLVPVAAPQPKPDGPPTARSLRPVQSGEAYRIISPPTRGLVTPKLAEALETVFKRFAYQCGFTADKPLEICLARGFKAGSHGHSEGRAADIAAVGGKGLLVWKQEWDRAMATTEKPSDLQQRAEAIGEEQRRNLGYGLYKTLQEYGGWRVDQQGWRPYLGVVQLFGPWTATEGPWKAMQIKHPNPCQRQRLADQQWVFQAHQDHIHVAR